MSLIKSFLQSDFSAREYVSECQDFIEWNITYLFNMFSLSVCSRETPDFIMIPEWM